MCNTNIISVLIQITFLIRFLKLNKRQKEKELDVY